MLCVSFHMAGFRKAQTMAFAVNEINRDPSLLPNVTLGYSYYDTCYSLDIAFREALSMMSGREQQFQLKESCAGPPPTLGIVGADCSTNTVAISNILGLYMVPMVSSQLEPHVHHQFCMYNILLPYLSD